MSTAGLQAAAAGATGANNAGGLSAAAAGAMAGLHTAAGAAGLEGLGLYGSKLTDTLSLPAKIGLNTGEFVVDFKIFPCHCIVSWPVLTIDETHRIAQHLICSLLRVVVQQIFACCYYHFRCVPFSIHTTCVTTFISSQAVPVSRSYDLIFTFKPFNLFYQISSLSLLIKFHMFAIFLLAF